MKAKLSLEFMGSLMKSRDDTKLLCGNNSIIVSIICL